MTLWSAVSRFVSLVSPRLVTVMIPGRCGTRTPRGAPTTTGLPIQRGPRLGRVLLIPGAPYLRATLRLTRAQVRKKASVFRCQPSLMLKFDWDSSSFCLKAVASMRRSHTVFRSWHHYLVKQSSWLFADSWLCKHRGHGRKHLASGWGCSGEQWLNSELTTSTDQFKQVCVTQHCSSVRWCGIWIELC